MPKNYTIARIVKGGQTFEILVDPDAALKYRLGGSVSLSKVLVYDQVFKDSKKGIKAREDDLKKFFGTSNINDIVTKIVREGELQVTAEQRRELIEEKKRQIIDFISRNVIDPSTKMPIPPQRIELAMEEAGVSIDPFTDARLQAPRVMERLKKILPMKVEITLFYIKVPGESYSRVQSYVKSVGKLVKESWHGDGSWSCELEAPAGLLNELIDRIASITKGQGEVRPKGV
ncbi:MAG: ribosome assembly factor SBDS [Aigarchaeota archaeon]|nr:ribosome assembly factor SBDS [Aigarchaeota archaeon]MDW8092424.1 ribosome assembly factor SBDS [Nitrososphaerota archaeon]